MCALCASASPMFEGTAQAPVARMTSTSSMMRSSYGGTSASTDIVRVQGFRTSASKVYGGVTSEQTYASMGGSSAPRRAVSGHPGECPHCIDENGDDICDRCGMDIYECDEDTCWCPIGDGKDVWMFMAALAVAYAVYKKHTQKKAQLN